MTASAKIPESASTEPIGETGVSTTRPLVSIVVVSFNNESFIAECLRCALAQDYEPTEVVVIDQCSRDQTRTIIAREFPDVRVLENDTNTGFSAGMNRGIANTRGDLVLLLNSDLFLEPSFLRRAVASLTGHSHSARVGMLATVVHCYRQGQRTSKIDSLGQMLVPYHAVVDSDQGEQDEWVAGPAGSVMLLSRVMLNDIRLPAGDFLDERYFCYGEDTELALRAQIMGWRCLFVPLLAGWHMGGSSAHAGPRYLDKPPALRVHAIKNRYLTLLSCYPVSLLLWTLPWQLLTESGQVLAPLVKRQWTQLGCVARAYREVVRLLPYAIAKRRWVLNRRRVSSGYLRSLYVSWGPRKTFDSLWKKA